MECDAHLERDDRERGWYSGMYITLMVGEYEERIVFLFSFTNEIFLLSLSS
jgi:hypothetical protein